MSKLEEFLAGERPDDVALYLSGSFLEADSRLREVGEETADGVVLVVDGEAGRNAFAAGTGMDAMEFAQTAMGTEGDVHADLSGGTCPEASEADAGEDDEGASGDHEAEFVFAFAEEQNEEVGGLYAEGAVVHAYAQCECGTAYSDRWVVNES
jgi:hypothetical protein